MDHAIDHMISDPLSSLSRSTECIEKTELSVDEILLRAPSSTSMPNLAIPKGEGLLPQSPAHRANSENVDDEIISCRRKYLVYAEQNHLNCNLDREIYSCVNTRSRSRSW